jgi:3-hydroxyisobutyrate dehydrogenase-like beta-hydroxyacid dehydrogenase
VTKAANQVVVGLTIQAVAEALTLARKAGVDPARVRDALLAQGGGERDHSSLALLYEQLAGTAVTVAAETA